MKINPITIKDFHEIIGATNENPIGEKVVIRYFIYCGDECIGEFTRGMYDNNYYYVSFLPDIFQCTAGMLEIDAMTKVVAGDITEWLQGNVDRLTKTV